MSSFRLMKAFYTDGYKPRILLRHSHGKYERAMFFNYDNPYKFYVILWFKDDFRNQENFDTFYRALQYYTSVMK